MKSIGIIVLVVCTTVAAEPVYPQVDVSFRAAGTIYVPPGGSRTASIQIAFEENYQHGREWSALTTFEGGLNSTVIEYLREKEAFIFQGRKCQKFGSGEAHFETDLRPVRLDKSGQYVLPIRQLLSLNTSYLESLTPETVTFRGVLADEWTFKINGADDFLEVSAVWSKPDSTTTSAKALVPLRFKIQRAVRNAVSQAFENITQTVEINLFTHGEYNAQVFNPRRGVFCPRSRDPTIFPEFVMKKLKTLHTKVEQVVKDFRKVGVVDTWFDPENELYKVNFSPIRERVKNGVQRIISKVQGVVYEVRESRKCVVKAVEEAKKTFDPETIFNPFDEKTFSIEGFFGTGETTYTSAGQTIERGVPCNLYQGKRSNWPPNETGITTLWEWCIGNQVLPDIKLQVNGFPLISLNIYVTESPYSKTESLYYKDLQLSYNFYDVRNNTKEYLDNLAFDIKECFEDANQKILMFKSKIEDEVTRKLIERNTRHQAHVAAWKAALHEAAKVKAGSLRISTVQTRLNANELEVSFTLLGRHPDLPKTVEEISLDQAVANVKTTLDEGKVAVSVDLGTPEQPQKANLKGEPGTLQAKTVVDEEVIKKTTGLSAGSMAAVAVVMLALGAAVGAAVFFMKKRRHYQRL